MSIPSMNMNNLMNLGMVMPVNNSNATIIRVKPRRSFTAGEKLAILQEVKDYGFNVTQRKYKIQGTQISKWRKRAEELKRLTEKSASASRVITVSTESRYPELEKLVYRQYSDISSQITRVTNNQIQGLAKQAALSPEMKEIYGDEVRSAKFGQVWLNSFKRRYNIAPQNNNMHIQSSHHMHHHPNNLNVMMNGNNSMVLGLGNHNGSMQGNLNMQNAMLGNGNNGNNNSQGIPLGMSLGVGQMNMSNLGAMGLSLNVNGMNLNMANMSGNNGMPMISIPVNMNNLNAMGGMNNMGSMNSLNMPPNMPGSLGPMSINGNLNGNLGINQMNLPLNMAMNSNSVMNLSLGMGLDMNSVQSSGHILIDGPLPLDFHGNIEGAYLSDSSEDDVDSKDDSSNNVIM